MKKYTVAVLMGGQSGENEVSLASGSMVLEALLSRGHQAYAVEITKQGLWRRKDQPLPQGMAVLESIAHALRPQPDVVFIALHGPKGEDGTVQGLLEIAGIPYTGSGVLASALGMDKHRSRQIFKEHGLVSPPYIFLRQGESLEERLREARERFGVPLVIKPNNLGSSLMVAISSSLDHLRSGLEEILAQSSEALIEKYLPGKEITVPLIGNDSPQALPVIEIVPAGLFFDYRAKYNGSTLEICPARIEEKIAKKAQEIAVCAFQALGCRGFARADMIYFEESIYLLEINTIPGLTRESLLPKSAKVAGLEFPDLVEKIIELGLESWKSDT